MKIPIKLGLWFSLCILLIEMISMTILHRNLVHSRVHQELEQLQASGNSQREILEIKSDSHTLSHIRLLGLHSENQVVVTNTKGDIIVTSVKIDKSMRDILNTPIDTSKLPKDGKIIQSDWKNEKYCPQPPSMADIQPVAVTWQLNNSHPQRHWHLQKSA